MDSSGSRGEDDLSNLDEIRPADSSPEESNSETSTTSSSDECCWAMFRSYKKSTVQQIKPTIPEIRFASPSQVCVEMSLDPLPRACYVTMSRYSVQLTGFPVTHLELVYAWMIDLCEELNGYRGLYTSSNTKEEVFVEFASYKDARCAASALNGRRVTEARFLMARVITLPKNSKRVSLKETQV